jgi:protein disulfide-isomerase A1
MVSGAYHCSQEKWPAFAIQDVEKNQKFPYDQEKEITAAEIEIFVDSYLDGSLKPSVKSEPIPEKQEGPVTVVVAHTYKDIVLDDSKDVLIELYAPWVHTIPIFQQPLFNVLSSVWTLQGARSQI